MNWIKDVARITIVFGILFCGALIGFVASKVDSALNHKSVSAPDKIYNPNCHRV